jgi:hypothetical protein
MISANAAIRFITSAPVPVDQRIGSRPMKAAQTVIALSIRDFRYVPYIALEAAIELSA